MVFLVSGSLGNSSQGGELLIIDLIFEAMPRQEGFHAAARCDRNSVPRRRSVILFNYVF